MACLRMHENLDCERLECEHENTMNHLIMLTLSILLCHKCFETLVDDIFKRDLPRDQFLEAMELALAEGFQDLVVDVVEADYTWCRSISVGQTVEWTLTHQ